MEIVALLRRPRSTWLWKASFQIHLWIGLLLTLYAIVIGVTGSLLVFRAELQRLATTTLHESTPRGPSQVDLQSVLTNVQAAYRNMRIISIATPSPAERDFLTTVQGTYGRAIVRSDSQTGRVIGILKRKPSWLDFLANLHATWLFGVKGRIANGMGAALLLMLNMTGLVIWWPGIKLWPRGLKVNLRRSWRRINYDLHRASGFWAIALLTIWTISGIYFAWPKEFFNAVNRLSPIVSARPPSVRLGPVAPLSVCKLSTMLASAQALDSGSALLGVNFPYSRRAPLEILMLRPGGTGREYTDTLYFNPWDCTHIATWRYGINESLGDWIIWSQIPLHFGTSWGLGIKFLWALAGLTIPLLAISGALMYWNRVLRHAKRS